MSALDRSRTPESGSLRHFDFPEVTRRRTSNGIDLRVTRMSRLPVVSLNLFIRAGEAALKPDNAGLAVFAADALEGGSRSRNGSEWAEALERLGARVSTTAGWEGTSIGLSCLADRLPDALSILAETVLEPGFPEDEVGRAREQILAGLRQRRMDPASLASDAAVVRYFAEGAPYARPLDGTPESVSGHTRDDLRGFVDANYRPETGGLVVVGDVDAGEVEQMVAEHLGEWSGTPATTQNFSIEAATTSPRVQVIHRPGAVQSEIRIGHIGAARSTSDYFALSIANMVLGGMFTSRLNLNLREEHGYTYGIRSRFTFRSSPGPFQVATSVGNDVTAPAVNEIMHELRTMAEKGPTDEEVSAARDYAAGVFGLQLETAGQIATRVTQLVIYGLADDYFDTYRDAVRSVKTEEAAAAAARHIRPDEAQIVVAGDADVIGPAIDALGLGPMEVVAADE